MLQPRLAMIPPVLRLLAGASGALAACLLLGCSPVVKNGVPLTQVIDAAPPASPAEYEIQAGDQLRLAFALTPELDVEQPVRPDGRITVAFLQDVQAAGLTARTLADDLRQRLAGELVNPDITVSVLSFTSYSVHVGGEVRAPGAFSLTGSKTVVQAIFEAGGVTEGARLNEVIVIRRVAGGARPVVIPVDLRAALFGEDTAQDIALMPLDAVYVPKTRIANVNKWIDQYIRKNLPVPFAVRPSDF